MQEQNAPDCSRVWSAKNVDKSERTVHLLRGQEITTANTRETYYSHLKFPVVPVN